MSALPKALRLLALLVLALAGGRGSSSQDVLPGVVAASCAARETAPAASWTQTDAWVCERATAPSESESEEECHDGPAPLGGPYASGELRPMRRRARPIVAALYSDRARERRDLARGPPPARAQSTS